ncbi:hypothetical protein CRE_18825 [Caenorhabditis remanei]|uniref:Uncharacterized protein n=2 Tax=Caenorhabditis remanei TaxID=31234 RepID=E3LKP9_CAERE|nr:hypothetical protein CRE_18825 [Caenorhabditis remanei]
MPPLEANYDESINKSTDFVDDHKWGKLFPTCVADPDRSSQFMTRMIYVAFSTVLHRRGILSTEYFSKNYITEKSRCLTLCFKNPKALAIAQKLKSAGEAVKKGYLKELSLVLSNNEDDEEAFEVYSMKFHYFKDGGVAAYFSTNAEGDQQSPREKLSRVDYKGTGSVKDQLLSLLRGVLYMTHKILTPLQEGYAANLRVNYTDETPEDFKIDGFSDSNSFYSLPQDIQSATIGHVRPGYHGAVFECASIHMNDAYQAEMSMKRYHAKNCDSLGYNANETLFTTMDSENDPKASQTLIDSVTPASNEKKNTTVENLAKSLDQSATVVTPKQTRATRKNAGEAVKTRTSPYSKTRSRK